MTTIPDTNRWRLADPERWFRWGVPAFSAAILGVLALCGYWAVVDRAPPVTISHGTVEGSLRLPNGNTVVFIHWHGVRHRTCRGVSRRWLSDGAVLPLPDIAYPPGNADEPPGPIEWEVVAEVPGYLAATGHKELAYRITIQYACNPLQELAFPIEVVPPPVPFIVSEDGAVRPRDAR